MRRAIRRNKAGRERHAEVDVLLSKRLARDGQRGCYTSPVRNAAARPWLALLTRRHPGELRLSILTGVALLAGVLLRLAALDADPPPFLSTDFGDEATWAFAARNHLLHGPWTCGNFNIAYYTAPLFSAISYLSMRAAGLTLWAIRFPAAFAGIAGLFVFWIYLRHTWDDRRVFVATSWFCLNQFHVAHSRVGLVETSGLLMEMLVWGCLFFPGRIAAALAGVVFGISFLVKASAAQDLPALALIFLIGWFAKRRQWIDTLYFVIAAGTVIESFFVIRHVSFDKWSYAFLQLAGWGVVSPRWFTLFGNSAMLLLLFPAVGSIFYFLTLRLPEGPGGWRAFCEKRTMEAYAAAVVVGNVAAIAMNSYVPERRFLILAPAAIVLATAACFELADRGEKPRLGFCAAGAIALLLCCAGWSGVSLYFVLFERSVLNFFPMFGRIVLLAALASAVLLRKIRPSRRAASIALAAAIVWELVLGASWVGRATYFGRAAFTEIASMPADGVMLSASHQDYVNLAFPGCLHLEPSRYPVYFHTSLFTYYASGDIWKPHSFDVPPLVTYHQVMRASSPPGGRLVKSLVIVPGIGDQRPRARIWVWKIDRVTSQPQYCCSGSGDTTGMSFVDTRRTR